MPVFRRTSLFASTTFAVLATAAGAAAQTPPVPTAAEPEATDSASEIVVTARRREELLQDVPISVSQLSGADLESAGVSSMLDIQYQTPSLTVTTSGQDRSTLAFSLRGQRSQEVQLLADPPVGTYFAEVVQPRPIGFGRAFFDLRSVQVLKGVQGTLFGRNVTGGAVLVEPNLPDDAFAGEIRGQTGELGLTEFYGMLNVPLGENAALRFAGLTHQRDGFSTETTTGREYDDEDYDAFRVGLMLRPLGSLESYTVGDYFDSDENGTANFATALTPVRLDQNGNVVLSSGSPIPTVIGQQEGARQFGGPGGTPLPLANIPANFAAAQALQATGRRLDIGAGEGGRLDAFNTLPYSRQTNTGITNRTTMEFGDATLKNIFGYRHVEFDRLTDFDGLPAALITARQFTDIEQYSEELQLQGEAYSGALSYTFGAFYFLEEGVDGSESSQFPELTLLGMAGAGAPINPFTAPASLGVSLVTGEGRAETYSLYAAGAYDLSDTLSLAAGVRWTNDERTATITPLRPNLGAPPGTCTFNPTPLPGGETVMQVGPCSFRNSASWDAITWDATLQWEPTDSVDAYFSVRRGFRAGGFSLRAQSVPELQSYDPETVTEYEVGLKNTFRNDGSRGHLNFALFYQDYRDVQKQVPVFANGIVLTVTSNTAKQENYGGEVEFDLSFANGFHINAFYSYVQVNVLEGGDPLVFDATATPEHQAGLTLGYARMLGNLGELDLTATASYRSEQFLDDRDAASREDAYTLVNLRASLDNIAGSNVSAAAFVNNAFDEEYRIGVLGLMDTVGLLTSIYGDPRTAGVELSYRF